MNGGCKGYSCIDHVYTPHYSFAILEDEIETRKANKRANLDEQHKAKMGSNKVETKTEIKKKVEVKP
jgi:hypothetical protein